MKLVDDTHSGQNYGNLSDMSAGSYFFRRIIIFNFNSVMLRTCNSINQS